MTDQDARVGGFIHEKGKGCILVVNKWDLIQKDSETLKEFEKKVYENLKYLSYAPILFISAKTGQRVDKDSGSGRPGDRTGPEENPYGIPEQIV